ncbi:MAG: hypothetical protein JNL25_02985 [Rhodospirillaceae bacterium]|nr:hypothetical protein [Rhodospirillaceae bacterium]
MSKLLLISLGKLNGAVLEAAARDGRFPHIIVATRNVAAAKLRANAARVGAALEDEYPRIDVVAFDFNAPDAAEALRRIQPDLMLAAPTLLPWWKLTGHANPRIRALPFGGWLACHLAPMLTLRAAWEKSDLHCPWVSATYPDVVNPILHMTGSGPIVGIGNVSECLPKIRFLASQHSNAPISELAIKLVGSHALSTLFYREEAVKELPPFLLQVLWHGHDISLAIKDKLRSIKMPVAHDLEINRITASAGLGVLAALLGDEPQALHAPAPNGLVGGYPVKISRKGVAIDLPSDWHLEQALGVNASALSFDGISAIEKDGTVIFTEKCAAALKVLLGEDWPRLRPESAPAMAAKLIAAVSS